MDLRRGAVWFGVLALVVVGGHAVLLLDRETVFLLAHEDSWLENLGALTLALAGVFFLLAFLRLRRDGGAPGDSRIKPLFLLFMAIVFFAGAGEEISWGQRILGFGTPETIRAVNFQEETTIHNLDTVYGLPIRPYRMFTLFWFSVVFAVPLACWVHEPARRFLARYIPLLPWTLGAVLLFNDLFSKGAEALIAADVLPHRDNERVEVRETIFSILCAATAFYLLHFVLKPAVRNVGERALRFDFAEQIAASRPLDATRARGAAATRSPRARVHVS